MRHDQMRNDYIVTVYPAGPGHWNASNDRLEAPAEGPADADFARWCCFNSERAIRSLKTCSSCHRAIAATADAGSG
jgi:hypothetical protein